jgi:hypothetical protein
MWRRAGNNPGVSTHPRKQRNKVDHPKRTESGRSGTRSRDAIARDAARRLVHGEAHDLADALARANQATGTHHNPSAKRVREHAQAIDLQAMGEAMYRARVRGWLELAEDIMATLAQAGIESLLVGRAAVQRFDGDPCIHIRVLAPGDRGITIAEIARRLAELGYEAAEAVFATLEVKGGGGGRLSQMRWMEDSARITLTRCTRHSMFQSRRNLATGGPAASLTLTQLQQVLASETRMP